MRQIIKVLLIIAMVAGLAYGGLCVYANCTQPVPGQVKIPSAEQAPYAFLVENTGTLVLADKYEQFGDTPGSRSYVLHGYWELVGNEFKRRSNDVVLSEQVFGEITIRRRQ
jgi:hypothetical protein